MRSLGLILRWRSFSEALGKMHYALSSGLAFPSYRESDLGERGGDEGIGSMSNLTLLYPGGLGGDVKGVY